MLLKKSELLFAAIRMGCSIFFEDLGNDLLVP